MLSFIFYPEEKFINLIYILDNSLLLLLNEFKAEHTAIV